MRSLLFRRRAPRLTIALLACSLALSAVLPAAENSDEAAKSLAPNEWRDAQGKIFKAKPVELLGPLALFLTKSDWVKYIPLRALSAEDCVRFHTATAANPPRAARWSDANNELIRSLKGNLVQMRSKKLYPADLDQIPEPELIIAAVGMHSATTTRTLCRHLLPFTERLNRVYPGRVVTIVVSPSPNLGLPAAMKDEPRNWFHGKKDAVAAMYPITRYGPSEGVGIVLLTRTGLPLLHTTAHDTADVMKFVDRAANLLWQLNPENPTTIADRRHYLKTVRPLMFATEKSAPLLLADPFRADVLRAHGVKRILARLEVTAAGSVSRVSFIKGSELPDALKPKIAGVLGRSTVILPAIDAGQPVDGIFDYVLDIPPENRQLDADAAWVQGAARVDMPIESWLLLKPIKVPEGNFSNVAYVTEDGVAVMEAVSITTKTSVKRQMNAFNSNWFDEAGAATVRPADGAKQIVDENTFTWRREKPVNGYIALGDSSEKYNYSIAYAWTEVEAPADMDAWLGLGSDDGVKVWVNGELVEDQYHTRPSLLDHDVVPLRLKKGKNQILIKVQNGKGPWSFTCRLRRRA